MNDITLQKEFAGHKFVNANVAQATKLIAQEGNNARNSVLRVCGIAAMVPADDYREEGFANGIEYMSQVFGVKSSQARLMLRVGAAFIEEGKCVLGTNEEWSLTQLVELLPIKDTAKQLAASGEVSPDMTVAQIKEVATAYKKPRKKRGGKHAALVSVLAIGPCLVSENGIVGVSLDGGRTMAFATDGLSDKAVRDRCYKAVREMLATIQ